MEHVQLNQDTLEEHLSVSAGQKHVLSEHLDEGQPRKKSKTQGVVEDIQSNPAFPGGYPDGALLQSPSVSGRENPSLAGASGYAHSDPSFDYDISQSARKTGRMAGFHT
jgi:hypothetical protein